MTVMRTEYQGALDILEQARTTEGGIDVHCNNYAAAVNLRHRLNYARARDRQLNKKTYAIDDPLYGRSVYDVLELRLPPKDHPFDNVLLIRPRILEDYVITPAGGKPNAEGLRQRPNDEEDLRRDEESLRRSLKSPETS